MKLSTNVAIFALCLVIEACNYGSNGVDATSIPLNPKPKDKIVISGDVANLFNVNQLKLVYVTDSSLPFCNGFNFPDGGAFALSTTVYIPTTTTAQKVRALIQPDRFSSGLCRWQLAGVHAIASDPKGVTADPLIAINYNWYKKHVGMGDQSQTADTSIFYCGYLHGYFSCVDGPIGDASYLPVELHDQTREAHFVIRDSSALKRQSVTTRR